MVKAFKKNSIVIDHDFILHDCCRSTGWYPIWINDLWSRVGTPFPAHKAIFLIRSYPLVNNYRHVTFVSVRFD